MGIRIKLLLLFLFVLLIPYVGYQSLREMESHLRSSLENTLKASAQLMALSVSEKHALFPSQEETEGKRLYIHSLKHPMLIDGYTDDWQNYHDWTESYSDNHSESSFKLIIGQHQETVYVLIEVIDKTLIYQKPFLEETLNGDYIEFILDDEYIYNGSTSYFFNTESEGRFFPFVLTEQQGDWEWEKEYVEKYITNINAVWRETKNGYVVELSLPAYLLKQRIGVLVHDIDTHIKDDKPITTGFGKNVESLAKIVNRQNPLQSSLDSQIVLDGRRTWILDRTAQVLASQGDIKTDIAVTNNNLFYAWFFPSIENRFADDVSGVSRLQSREVESALNGKVESSWRYSPDNKVIIVSAVAPVEHNGEVIGAVVIEETTNKLQIIQRDSLIKLFNKTMLIFMFVAFVLLIYASRLSWRLRKLSREAHLAIDEHGRVQQQISMTNAKDEIGDLSRSYASMLKRLHLYNDYLENMVKRLSHELRTPMTVVQSSLENLKDDLQSNAEHKDNQYLQRADEGVNRLKLLVKRLTEASRIEQAVQSSEKNEHDLAMLVSDCVSGYESSFSEFTFHYEKIGNAFVLPMAADLIVQMLDKLIANAVSFSKEKKIIEIDLEQQSGGIVLSITNYGSSLPEQGKEQIFNSMISVREEKGNEPHLGLGLYIVRLISEFHNADVDAQNTKLGDGVTFSVKFRL